MTHVTKCNNKALWYAVLGAKLLPLVIADPENAYPAAIGKKARDLPELSGCDDNDVRFALLAMEDYQILESKKVNLNNHQGTKVRRFTVTELGMVLIALTSEPHRLTLKV